jgi:uncharacterized cupredoxin-like copper-binding protein
VRPIRTAILTFVIVAAVAACASAAVPSTLPTGAPTVPSSSTPVPTAAPSASPVAVAVAAVAAIRPAVVTKPTISLYEWKVIAPSTLKAGKSTFTISNFGAVPHELLVFKSPLGPEAYPIDAEGNIKEEGAGVDLLSDGENIDPTGAQVRTINLVPGTYLFVCNIPGHFKAGMFARVTVTR